MIALSNSVEQTVAVGEAIVFDLTLYNNGCCCNKMSRTSTKLCEKGTYEIHFSANIGGTPGVADVLSIRVGGENLPGGTVSTITGDATYRANVSTTTLYHYCCNDYGRISVVNTGTAPVIIGRNSSLVIHKICN